MTDYTYDPLERLRTVAYPGSGAITYGYDLGGNRTSVSSPASSSTYGETDQLKVLDGVTNKFDRNGNLQSIGAAGSLANTFVYDMENRLYRTGPCRADVNGDGTANIADTGIIANRFGAEGTAQYDTLADVSADGAINVADIGIRASENGKQCKSTDANTGNGRYWFNGDGLRVGSRTFNATAPTQLITSYVWDAGAGMPSVLQETTTDNAAPPVSKTTTYLYGLDLIASTVGSGAAVFYLTDGLGSTRELVTSSADVVDNYHYTYDVWGGLRSAQPATMNDFRFTGEQTDVRANRGLVYLRARFYDPALGRFLNRDPLPLGNRYAYVGNSPVNATDPSGLCPVLRAGVTPTSTPTPYRKQPQVSKETGAFNGCGVPPPRAGGIGVSWGAFSNAVAVLDLLPNTELCFGGALLIIAASGGTATPAVGLCAAADRIIGGAAGVATQINIINQCDWRTLRFWALTGGQRGERRRRRGRALRVWHRVFHLRGDQ